MNDRKLCNVMKVKVSSGMLAWVASTSGGFSTAFGGIAYHPPGQASKIAIIGYENRYFDIFV